MVVGDLALSDDDVVREDATNSLVKATADGLFRNFEFAPGGGATGIQFSKRFLDEVQRGSSGVGLEVGACSVALERVRPLRNVPLEFGLWQQRCFGQIDFHAVPGGLDVADIHQSGECS